MAETEDRHWWFCGRRAIAEQFIRDLGNGKNLKILEIGAGTGGNLKMLSKYGDLTAVEMAESAREIAQKKTGRKVVDGYLPRGLPEIGNNYDLICMFDVLEHVEDDAGALETVYELLTPGGRLLLTVPAYQWMWSIHDEYLHHFRRYTRSELKKKLRNAHFAPTRISYLNMFLFPFAVIVRYLDKFSLSEKTSNSIGSTIPHPLINELLKITYSSEKHIMRKFNLPYGLGIISISKKSS